MRKTYRNEEVAKLAYFLMKDVGICVRCQANWAEKRKVLCWACAEYWRMQKQVRKPKKLVLVKKGA